MLTKTPTDVTALQDDAVAESPQLCKKSLNHFLYASSDFLYSRLSII